MKTDDLVALLAAQAEPVDRKLPARRYLAALLTGLLGAAILMVMLLGVRPDLRMVAATPLFWFKLSFPLLLALGAGSLMLRLSRPGMETRGRWWRVATPVLAVWVAALATLAGAPSQEWQSLVMGSSWRSCPINIAILSVPGFVALFWAVKAMAPTRLRAAGAVTGLLAGASATIIYCLHCPEMAVPFWAVWYLLGMLIPAALGALLGPRWLRW